MRLSSAHVIALLALFVALSGSATAAVLITGAHVRDGSLTGADVRDGSLLPRDLGETSSFTANPLAQAVAAENKVLASVDVPAGTYLVTGNAQITALQPGVDQLGECSLTTPETTIERRRVGVGGDPFDLANGQRAGNSAQIVLAKVADTRGGRVSLTCRQVDNNVSTLKVDFVTLNAVPVGALRE